MQELPFSKITTWFIHEGIALDEVKAKKLITQKIGTELMTPGMLHFNEFLKLFQKGIFKQALAKISQIFESGAEEGTEQLSLRSKLEQYQRRGMFKGMDPRGQTFKETKRMMDALRDVFSLADADYIQKRVEYRDYLSNVLNRR